jgi:hypothetical protein
MTTPFSSTGFNGKPVPGFPVPLTSFKYGDFTSNLTAPEVDPYQAIRDKYAKTKAPAPDFSKMDSTERLTYGLINPDPNIILMQAEIQAVGAKEANKMARENIDYASKIQQEFNEKKTQRDFRYGALARLMDLPATMAANQATMNVLGARSAVDAMNQTLASYPRMSFASAPYQGPQKYFS